MQATIAAWARSFSERARVPVDFAAIERECASCGGPVRVLARQCPECGSRFGLDSASLMVAGALALLVAALAVGAAAVLGWHQIEAATTTGGAADELIIASSRTDFGWLSDSMSGCDTIARNDPAALHFLVTPLASTGEDVAPWRAKSINSKGDGILLRTDDALVGLKRASLRVSPAEYVFSLTDVADGTIYGWRAASGVARFSNANASAVSSFTIQFRKPHGSAGTWETTFNRQDGSCYWVNPIIGE